jgi:exopolysaccharide/PEP-CTERM locus tyrosine autokinase
MSLVERALSKMRNAQAAGRDGAHHAGKPAAPGGVVRIESNQPKLHLDRAALRAAEILPPISHEHRIADEYRQIKRPLVAAAVGRGGPQIPNGQLIMVTSALPGDGKTFTSVNLALSLALEKDSAVLLVDADVAKPHISRLLGIQDQPGLLDVLQDETRDVESMILPTDIPGLSVLSAGRWIQTATELLASNRMERIVAQLGARDPSRIVLFDSPPLLLTSESRALTSVVGQVVFVVRAGSTPQRAVFDALELVGTGKSVGLVLNQSEEPTSASYYNYHGQREDSTSPPGTPP